MMLKVNKLLLMSVALTLFLVSPMTSTAPAQERFATSSTAALADWQTYTVKGEEFSVSLPGVPAMSTKTVDVSLLVRDRKQRLLGVYADGVVYAIYTFENPNHRQSLADIIAEGHGDPEDKPQRDLNLGGFSGKEYGFKNGDRTGVSQFYITDHHVYLFRAVGSNLVNPDVAISKFLSSIRVEKKPDGIEVVNGPGEQPNSDPSRTNDNSEARPFTGKEVALKAKVVTKPEPPYTEAARQNEVTGTVVLRCVFSSSGAVTNLRAVSGLPYGLTENAIDAARQIRFIPAIKDGHFVSMWIQLEYNFNLY